MASIPVFNHYFKQFHSVVTLESLPAVCVVGLNPEPGTDPFLQRQNFIRTMELNEPCPYYLQNYRSSSSAAELSAPPLRII
jgi:hypothetical protein